MKTETQSTLAYIKYEGELVKEGYLDARKSGEVLVGLDKMLRYCIYKVEPELTTFEFELPIKVQKGSIEIIISDNIIQFLAVGGGIVGSAKLIGWAANKYIGAGLEQMGKNDFKDASLKKTIIKSSKLLLNVITLVKHLGTTKKKVFNNISFSKDNKLVNVKNENGEIITLPLEVIEIYKQFPFHDLNKLTNIVEDERKLIVGVIDNDVLHSETVDSSNKDLFIVSSDDEIILPELKHGDFVEIEGYTTKANENTNNIGIDYKGHIITCYPIKGNVKEHKNKLFTKCSIKGIVDRLDNGVIEKRPKIKFTDLEPLDDLNPGLFDK